jgi:hypothetical protein
VKAAHPDAHFDPGFLKALKASVRRALPKRARHPWWKLVLIGLVGGAALGAGAVMLTGLGVAATHVPPVAAAFGLFLAAMTARPPAEVSHRAAFLQVLAKHPAEARHVLHWLRRAETVTVCVFPAIALTSALLYLIASRSELSEWLPVLAVAAAAGLINSGVYALLHFWPALQPLRVLAFLVCFGTFLTLKATDEAGSAAAQFVVQLNPIHWPLPALQRPLNQTEWLRLAAGLTGSLAVLLLAWRHLPRCAARDVARLDLTDAASAPDVRRAQFTLRLPAFLAPGPVASGPGFWEIVIARTLTPPQSALAALACAPEAPTLGGLFRRCLLRLLLTAAGGALLGWMLWSEGAVAIGLLLTLIICWKTLFAAPARDGTPFGPLLHFRPLPGGQAVTPLALLPVRWRDFSALFLKCLWPRCLLLLGIFLPAGLGLDALLHTTSSRPQPGLPATIAALAGTGCLGVYALLVFTWQLMQQTGRCRRGWSAMLGLLPVLPLQMLSAGSGVTAFVLSWNTLHSAWLLPLTLSAALLCLLCAAAAHRLLLHRLENGDIDLWMIPGQPAPLPTRRA